MKLIKFFTLIFALSLLFGCSHGASGDAEYEEMINTIKNIEISQNKLITFNTTFDKYKKAFEGKFITENLEKHFIGEDQESGFPLASILKGDIDQEFLEDPMKHVDPNYEVNVVNGAIVQKLTKIDFSKLYLNDTEDKATIYAKKSHEYDEDNIFVDEIKGLDDTKSHVIISKYVFKKMENEWKIMSIDDTAGEIVLKNEETGKYELFTPDAPTHLSEEIDYIKTIDVESENF
ncbi:hypothetical protein NSA47_08760 [Irregularibacter muris]|uniref:Lipoprotein n=1 Tax=Irregularibacter muris TaxID=1796619 RepID=A0AAE3KZS1_9FIRM|nr:hypothetical protein [Irregularibacter muris]MCR1899071.1 hypothetical protein [Irregularibacter muris]